MLQLVKSIRNILLIKNETEELQQSLEEINEEDSIGIECMPYYESEFF